MSSSYRPCACFVCLVFVCYLGGGGYALCGFLWLFFTGSCFFMYGWFNFNYISVPFFLSTAIKLFSSLFCCWCFVLLKDPKPIGFVKLWFSPVYFSRANESWRGLHSPLIGHQCVKDQLCRQSHQLVYSTAEWISACPQVFHNGTGSQWDWLTVGLGHNRTMTQWTGTRWD